MDRGQLLVDYSQYQTHYQEVSKHIIHQPAQQRKCTDVAFAIMFLVFLVIFMGVGVLEISEFNSLEPVEGPLREAEREDLYIQQNAIVLIAGIASAVLTSFIYVLLLKTFPRPMVYFMIVLSMSILLGMAIIGLAIGNLGLFIGMGVTFLIYALVLCCLRKKIDTGIAMVKVATKFMSERMQVFLTPIVKIVLTFVFGAFFAYTLNAMAAIADNKNKKGQDSGRQAGFMTLWAFYWLLFMFVFYYMMTYTISVVCSYWYYGIRGSKGSLLNAYKMMFQQFGSIVFAAMLISVVTFARMAVQGKKKQNKNIAVAVCLCIVSCLLKAIQDLLRVLNHYTIIMMSVTGQGFVDSAKSTMGLIWKQLGLLSITNIICNFLVLWGLIISVGIPCIVSFLLMRAKTDDQNEQALIVVLVAICSMLISTVVFQIIVESVSCIFMYYSLDKDMIERGLIQDKRIAEDTYLTINRYSTNPYLMDGDAGKQNYERMG